MAGIEVKVLESANATLIAESSVDDIRAALFQMHPNQPRGLMVCMLFFIKTFGILLVMILWHIFKIGGRGMLVWMI